jgi:hypothetical protein
MLIRTLKVLRECGAMASHVQRTLTRVVHMQQQRSLTPEIVGYLRDAHRELSKAVDGLQMVDRLLKEVPGTRRTILKRSLVPVTRAQLAVYFAPSSLLRRKVANVHATIEAHLRVIESLLRTN